MGVSEKPGLLDNRLWAGKAFDGAWSTALSTARDAVEPATGQVFSRVGIASAADMQAAIGRAQQAQAAWAATGPRERAAVFHRAASIFEQHFDELAMTVARETGGIVPKGQHEVREAITLCHLAAALPMQAQGQVLPSTPGRLSIARRVPHGVVGVISPFNFPLILGLRSVAPALALGNAVVLKPDTRTPVSGGFIMARVFEEAGLPKGLLQVVPGDAEAGEALVVDERVPMIAFTGSPTVGRRIGALAGQHLKKVSLELGGANNLIILEDADLDAAASAAAFGAWFHQGQICMAINRIIVEQPLLEAFRPRRQRQVHFLFRHHLCRLRIHHPHPLAGAQQAFDQAQAVGQAGGAGEGDGNGVNLCHALVPDGLLSDRWRRRRAGRPAPAAGTVAVYCRMESGTA